MLSRWVGGGAEKCVEHIVPLLGDRRVRVVCPEAWLAAIPASGGAVCHGFDGQTDVITLPFVLLLLDYWPLERMSLSGTKNGELLTDAPRLAFSRLVLEKVPLLFLSVLSALITVKAQRSGMAVRSLQQFPLGVRIENAIVAYGLYLWKMVWPSRLARFTRTQETRCRSGR